MTAATKLLTLKAYLARENVAEKHYELVSGNLIEMPPESPQNAEIAIKLLLIFAQFISPRLLRCKDTEIVVSGTRATVRLPDLMVLTENLADDLYSNQRSTINIDMLPPALVVEVVSPGKANRDRDYRYKRSEYAARGIAEYWIVDPQENKVTVLLLDHGLYQENVYQDDDSIDSQLLTQLQLTASQVFSAST
ncbi:MAG: Uma2 family endonuclease [Pleurocapsa minor HA4230-MV1]|jgi:Uma2 family endonuclease|nr:Uma2 family endonuclease [Pleurocapsa minor HA4230-MV1]